MPSMRWSQWMVEGTAVVGSPEEMNCSTAICAVASCMATRSAEHMDQQTLSLLLQQRMCYHAMLLRLGQRDTS